MRSAFVSILVTVTLLLSSPAFSVLVPDPPSLSAKGYILMDFQSGTILASSEQDTPLAPASLTKVMTAYLVGLEINAGRLKWDDKAVVSVNAWSMKFPDSSKMFIQPKDEIAIRDLMKGIIVQSGNDACVAVAEHIAGSEEAFVSLMNETAKAIGMKNTRYINAHGLDGAGIQTTAYDMAVLMQHLIKDTPEVYELYKVRDFTWNRITQYNRNKLLWDKSLKVDGGKTGFTDSAGYSLTASAKEGRLRLISVVMGTKSKRLRTEETRQLLTYGFRFYDTKNFAKSGEVLTNRTVWKGAKDTVALGVNKDVFLTLPQNKIGQTERVFEVVNPLEAPLASGQTVGKVKWLVDGEVIHSETLVTKESVYPASWIGRTSDTVQLFINSVVKKQSN
ncbi:D-alanyl-D-alanine carboxypeptidase family protein [Vibrio sp. SCSIO 43137]|uniref:D-alanyl-D-alanine carboxypeptidase family protein n=1 Tax=Vibrio sp. SCSIO 43137 TaxID=3021011 RepID=UPI002307A5EF|nr:D-alanyl-D-alanine carboxypeptidase family protein [Vibrio sp. SCSIO 43137]WCE28649.1 D-alanyl-D-alanine carboxypeptidase [Vibrio sp. SCSIO 43137]